MTRCSQIGPFSRVVFLSFVVVFLTTLPAMGVEHPGSIEKDANCASCHGKKISGASVHSAMAMPCTVCHVAMTQGDMTTLTLLMPKEKICFACHEQSTAMQQHVPAVKGRCIECHDAHSSNQRMLLLKADTLALSSQKK